MSSTLTPEVIQTITREYLKRELDKMEQLRNKHVGPMPLDAHPSNWAKLIQEYEKDLIKPERVVARQKVKQEARKLLTERGIEADKDSDEFRALTRALLTTKIEWAQEEQRRSKGDYSGGGSAKIAAALGSLHTYSGGQPSPLSVVLLSEAKDKYVKVKTEDGSWNRSSIKNVPPQIRDFIELVGDVPTDSLDRDKVRAYRAALLNMPARRNKKAFNNKTVQELGQLDLPTDERLGGHTLHTRFRNICTFLGWLEGEDLIPNAKKLNDILTVPKDRKPMKQPRTRFSDEDLSKLFNHPGYTEGKVGSGGFNLSYQFWTPLIALHTGARREEICQLHLNDIRQKNGVWVFDINDTGDKGVKTQAGIRIVPIHPVLIELGLLERVEHLKANRRTLLFPSLKPDKEGRYGDNAGKWFTRFRRKQGVQKGPESKQAKHFHSFRHTVISALLVAGVDRNKSKEVVGHQSGESDVTALYEHGYPVKTLYEDVICKLDFSDVLDLEAMKGSPWVKKE